MNPAQLQKRLTEGVALQQKGRLPEAAAIFAQIRGVAPKDFDGWHLGGNIALLQGNPGAAAELYLRALRLNPRSAVAATCLGVARLALGDPVGAETTLRSATRLEPKNAEIWNQLATALSSSGRWDEALKCHRQAVTLNPRSAQAWHGYGTTLSNQNLSAEALECERRAITADPAYTPARRGYAVALQKCHRVPEAVREYEAVLAKFPSQLEVHSHRLFALNYLAEQTPTTLFAAHQHYGKLVESSPTPVIFPNAPAPERKLRVAFFSADFREHSVAYFLEPLLQLLNRDQFEFILYSFCPKPDAVTERFRQLASVWRDCPSQIESVLEPIIRTDAPDIAIDLGGHTGNSLLPLFARRIAPVQISYLGYPNTTGLTAMDYRFVDATTDPIGEADQWHTETLVRFSPCAWVYSPPTAAPDVTIPPCVARGTITFGSFNNFAKVTDETLHCWATILRAVPGSGLLLKSIGLAEPGIVQQIRERLRAAGLPDERVELIGATMTTAAHLASYARIDIALDTMPYNGTTTTCEALWMGVPVVTSLGNRHAARVGASLLQAIGHSEWIAADLSHYVTIARSLAADPNKLTAIRTALRSDMQRSGLMDQPGQAARFGLALRECWTKRCGSKNAT